VRELKIGMENSGLSARKLIERASDCPDYGLAMRDLVEARQMMDGASVPRGSALSKEWEIVYEAVLGRETPENVFHAVPQYLT
jgi:hypothetical protein